MVAAVYFALQGGGVTSAVYSDYMTICTTPLKYAVDGMYHDVQIQRSNARSLGTITQLAKWNR